VARVSRDWFDSFNDAASGLVRAARTQRNIRLHLLFALGAVVAAVTLHLSTPEFVLVALVVGLVLVAELLNSALEGLVDLVVEHEHPLARAAKDVAAAAVLVAAAIALTCGWLIFVPRLRAPAGALLGAAARGPEYLTGLALVGTTLAVVLGKAASGRGQPLRGGMPSGHAAVAFSLASAGALISRDGLLALIGFGLALLVAQGRLLSRVHTLGEVIAGSLLGGIATLLLFQVLR
jgi:diacylglycerol kinase (ATP)